MKKSLLFLSGLFLVSCSSSNIAHQNPDHPDDALFSPKVKSPRFKNRRPVLCFDEGHHNLSLVKGRYQPVLGLMESDGYEVRREKRRFTSEILKSCEVLYISAAMGHPDISKTSEAAYPAFTKKEINAIEAWVKNGGGLLIMTDQRPMSSSMDPLLNRFGIHGSLTHVTDKKNMITPLKEAGNFEVKGNMINSKHPITEGIKSIFFFYGQALRGSHEADYFLTASPEAQIGELENTLSIHSYPALGVATQIGKGKVVAFGDANIFTSKLDKNSSEKTGINRTGSDNTLLAVNVFHWLTSE